MVIDLVLLLNAQLPLPNKWSYFIIPENCSECACGFYFQSGRRINTQNLPWNSNPGHLLTSQSYSTSCQQLKPWCTHKESSEITLGQLILFFKGMKSRELITLVMPDHSVSIPGLSAETNELSCGSKAEPGSPRPVVKYEHIFFYCP